MLELLRSVLRQHGEISGVLIDETEGFPSSAAYRHRFGSLVTAYRLIGYNPMIDFSFIEINRRLRQEHVTTVAFVIRQIQALGATANQDPATELLHLKRGLVRGAGLVLIAGMLVWTPTNSTACRLVLALRRSILHRKLVRCQKRIRFLEASALIQRLSVEPEVGEMGRTELVARRGHALVTAYGARSKAYEIQIESLTKRINGPPFRIILVIRRRLGQARQERCTWG